ncbi:MAG: hypothetical protein Q9172_001899 [Xanthocarpia lactea]
MYKSPEEREKFRRNTPKPGPKYNGLDILYEKWPRPGKKPRKLLDYPHLPDQIGTNEYWWVLEAWKRLDPRITYLHETTRAESNISQQHGSETGFQESQRRYDGKLEAAKGRSQEIERVEETEAGEEGLAKVKATKKTKARKKTIKPSDMVTPLMTEAQKAANTTRGLTPGLINKDLGEVPGNRVPWPEQSKLAGHHHTNRSRRARRSKGDHSRRIDTQAMQSQGVSRRQPLGVEENATVEVDETDDDTQAGSESPPSINLRLWVQPKASKARAKTVHRGAIASRGDPSSSNSIPPHAQREPDHDNDYYSPGNVLSDAPALDLATQPQLPAPLQSAYAFNSTKRQTPSHQMRLAFPGSVDDPAHPLYIPPYPLKAVAKVPGQGSNRLNPQADVFVPKQAQTIEYDMVAPAADTAYQQAPNTKVFGSYNGNEQAPAAAASPTTPSAPIPPRVTDHVRYTCPDELTPSRWADFLAFCVNHGIGRQD